MRWGGCHPLLVHRGGGGPSVTGVKGQGPTGFHPIRRTNNKHLSQDFMGPWTPLMGTSLYGKRKKAFYKHLDSGHPFQVLETEIMY